MKKIILGIFAFVFSIALVAVVSSVNAAPSACTDIKDGVLKYSAGHYLEGKPLVVGYDMYGYNYQSHMFNGSYANAYLGRYGFPPYEGDDAAFEQRLIDEGIVGTPASWYWDYRNDHLSMKWNDAWLSNKDCGTQVGQGAYTDTSAPDGTLDRHYDIDTYEGSGAWLTNHQSGKVDGKNWTYFTKIVAKTDVAFDCTSVNGQQIWGAFCTIQEVNGGYPELNEPYGGNGTVLLGDHPGFGYWQP